MMDANIFSFKRGVARFDPDALRRWIGRRIRAGPWVVQDVVWNAILQNAFERQLGNHERITLSFFLSFVCMFVYVCPIFVHLGKGTGCV